LAEFDDRIPDRPVSSGPALSSTLDGAPAGVGSPIADGRDRSLDRRTIQAERVAGGIFTAVLAVLGLIALIVFLIATTPGIPVSLVLFGAWLLAVIGIGLLGLAWPAVRYRYVSYRVDATGIRIRRGVVWRGETSVPRSRVQHTDVARGPIERAFGLATLIIHTAGTENASVTLSGLAESEAYPIRDFLLESGDDDAV